MKKFENNIYLDRIASALERINPLPIVDYDFSSASAFLWKTSPNILLPVRTVNSLDSNDLIGIESAKNILRTNTRRFAEGFSANNALLWGARGMGKSSLVKSVHAENIKNGLVLIEIQREDLQTIDQLLNIIRGEKQRFIIFCDDLSFNEDDSHYKSLKAVLDGGIQGTPENVILYATSNRRHLMPREMIDNEQSSAINPGEAVEEKVSLSDRFGIWLGFHPCSQEDYLKMIKGYVDKLKLSISDENLISEAIEWQQVRGSRSGRVAWQFIIDLAAREKVSINYVYKN